MRYVQKKRWAYVRSPNERREINAMFKYDIDTKIAYKFFDIISLLYPPPQTHHKPTMNKIKYDSFGNLSYSGKVFYNCDDEDEDESRRLKYTYKKFIADMPTGDISAVSKYIIEFCFNILLYGDLSYDFCAMWKQVQVAVDQFENCMYYTEVPSIFAESINKKIDINSMAFIVLNTPIESIRNRNFCDVLHGAFELYRAEQTLEIPEPVLLELNKMFEIQIVQSRTNVFTVKKINSLGHMVQENRQIRHSAWSKICYEDRKEICVAFPLYRMVMPGSKTVQDNLNHHAQKAKR